MTKVTIPYFLDDALLLSTQDGQSLPFKIRRVFIIRDIKKNTIRGRHAHKRTKQALFCIQGSVRVRLDDGKKKTIHTLKYPHRGVFIDNMVWSEMFDFSSDAILVVFASHVYKTADYVRAYPEFLLKTK